MSCTAYIVYVHIPSIFTYGKFKAKRVLLTALRNSRGGEGCLTSYGYFLNPTIFFIIDVIPWRLGHPVLLAGDEPKVLTELWFHLVGQFS